MSCRQFGEASALSSPVSPLRFHRLDGVRVTAMRLGVFYHLLIAMMTGSGDR